MGSNFIPPGPVTKEMQQQKGRGLPVCPCDRPDDFEDGVPVAQLVRLDVRVGQSSPQLPYCILSPMIRHDARNRSLTTLM